MVKDSEIDYSEVAPQEWLQVMITKAIGMSASDIHIEPEESRVIVRVRVDGILRVVDQLHLTYLNQVIAVLKVMAGLNIAETRRPQEGHIIFRPQTIAPMASVDLRLSIFRPFTAKRRCFGYRTEKTLFLILSIGLVSSRMTWKTAVCSASVRRHGACHGSGRKRQDDDVIHNTK